MDYQIKDVDSRKIAGFHLVGPWEKTVKQGFEQLTLWVKSKQLQPLEWIAAYYDNPDEVPAEKLRADVVIAVDEDFVLPENSEGVMLTELPGGAYAVARARVENEDFQQAWDGFFDTLLADQNYQIARGPCFEIYLNVDSGEGHWEIDMHIPVEPKVL
ncbi:DNA gyrase inhibitor SbmC [Enterobacter sp. SA187]|uniref:DNA gyrase inhibitor SbmC n=1 Tax=Enterobacter sp. SA187 TaxID=1914861 RepID=UPI0009333FBE|nr:DNA gyrase inhibitor SbmC [Enterobacter sp. SA187]